MKRVMGRLLVAVAVLLASQLANCTPASTAPPISQAGIWPSANVDLEEVARFRAEQDAEAGQAAEKERNVAAWRTFGYFAVAVVMCGIVVAMIVLWRATPSQWVIAVAAACLVCSMVYLPYQDHRGFYVGFYFVFDPPVFARPVLTQLVVEWVGMALLSACALLIVRKR